MPDIFDQLASEQKQTPASGDIFDQLAAEQKHPGETEVNDAIAAAPRPPNPIDQEIERQHESALRSVAQGDAILREAGEHPGELAGNLALPGLGTAGRGIGEIATPGKRLQGVIHTATGAADVLQPFIGPAALENPIGLVKGAAVGTASSEAARLAAKEAGATPEQQEAAAQAGFWIPTAVGGIVRPRVGVQATPEGTAVAGEGFGGRVRAGAAVTPEEVVLRGGVGSHSGEVRIPRPGAVPPEGATAEARVKPQPLLQDAVEGAAREAQAEQASKVAAGTAPAPPPPQPPPTPPAPQIPPQAVRAEAQKIETLPPEQRPAAVAQAHAELTDALAKAGTVVTPDGKVTTVKTPEKASTVAGKIINDEVKRLDKEAKEAEKATPERQEALGTQVEQPKTSEAIQPTKEAPAPSNAQPADIFTKLANEPKVGDKVTLPDGRTGEVVFKHAKLPTIRVKADSGTPRQVSIGVSQVKPLENLTPAENSPAKTPAQVVEKPKAEEISPKNAPKEPWQMTQVEASSKKAEAAFPLASKVEIKNGKPVYTSSTTVKWGDGERTFEVQSRGPLNGVQQAERLHRKVVEAAIAEGKPVPAEVLKDYPNLEAQPNVETKPQAATGAEPRSQAVETRAGEPEEKPRGPKVIINRVPVSEAAPAEPAKPVPAPLQALRKAVAKGEPIVGQPAAGQPLTPETTIEPEQQHEQPTVGHPAEGGREVRPAEGGAGNELGREQPEAVSRPEEERNAGEGTGRPSSAGNSDIEPVRGQGAGAGSGEGTGVSGPVPAAVERGARERERAVTQKAPKKNTDWFAHPEDFSVDATDSTRLKWNVDALKILKKVLKDNEKLTDEDRDALAHYVGWGALDKAFSPYNGGMWNQAFKDLQELMSEDELAAARRSTQNAHYTSPQIVRWTWSVLSRMGVRGGVILEPSMGTGNFFGMMPKGMRGVSQGIGNELDPTTYNIAKLLYPSATLFNKDFIELMMPNDSVDLAVSNVPFGVQVYDPKYKRLGRPAIHDYFAVKMLDKVRPGGALAVITSTYTLDKQATYIREILGETGDLLFAVRMPQDTFAKSAGTAVSTDLMVFRKRVPGEKPQGESFLGLRDVSAPYADYFHKPGQATKQINEYFAEHPENVLGKMEIGRGRTSQDPEDLVVTRTDDFEKRLKDALDRAPKDAFKAKSTAAPVLRADTDEAFASDDLEEGNYTFDGGKIKQRVNGVLVTPEKEYSLAERARMAKLIDIRELTRGLIGQMRTSPDDDLSNKAIEKQQAKLRRAVEAYQKQHGYFAQKKTKDLFAEDPHYPLLLSLEEFDKRTKTGTPADMLTKRTVYPPARLTSVSSDPKEALYQILGERGRPDLEFLADLSGKSVEEVAKPLVEAGLVFQEPNTGEWQTRDKYLSGYVREKLADAKKAVEQGQKQYEENVRQLEKVQPETVPINSGDPAKDIQVKLGATWISAQVVNAFGREVLNASPYGNVKFVDGMWKVSDFGRSAEIMGEFSGGGMSADNLLELALNQKQPVVKDKWRDENGEHEAVNPDKTIAAKRAQQKIKEEFAKWARNHEKLAPILEKIYNDTYNNIVNPHYDGSHLTFPGMNKAVLRDGKLQPHQVDAVWRLIQDGRGLLAHVVGAGKTYEMIASAMEMKRLGMIRKPMFAVPNHLVGQWAKDFLKLYPGAKILVPEKKDFDSKNRNRIMSKIATGNWDAVILPHSQFNLMDISPERQMVTLNRELDELEETYKAAVAKEGKKGYTVKRLEKARDRLRSRLAELKDLKADKTIRFDDTGIDQLFIDEAHAYKNLAFYTKMDRVAGLAQGDSKRATRLKMKTDYLLEKHGNRGVVFATGTPIQNTMAEMYNMIKYIAPDVLEKAGIRFFDDWAANFGEVITAMELAADGRTYKPRSKFARFTNVPELQMMFRSFADVKTKEDLDLPTPEIEGGKPQALTATPTPELEQYVQALIERAKRVRGEGGPRPDPKIDNMLKVTGDGRKAATDIRLIDPNYPDDPDSKINKVVDKIFEEWESGKIDKSVTDPDTGKALENLTQAIFLDNYQYMEEVGAEYDEETGKKTKAGKEEVLLNLYRDMADKLVKRGVPREQIAIIHDYPKQDQKTDLFDSMNQGKVRVLFGSTEKMGAGMNAQRRMKALIDVDSPWRPGDLEQRHGRIIRQGNLNKSVRLYHAITKGTFDSYMIQTLKGKAEFINQVMSGKNVGRTMTDAAGDMVLSLEEMLAASSNNPDVKRKMELEAEVAGLQALEREHESQIYRNERDSEREANYAAERREVAHAWERVQKDWNQATEGDKFSLDILGKHFDKYGDANEWIKDQDAPAVPFHFEINGVPARFSFINGIQGEPTRMGYTVGPFSIPRSIDSFSSLIASVNGYLSPKNVEARIRDAKATAEGAEEKATKMKKLASKSGFEDADKLKKAKEELEAVKKRLGLSDDAAANEQEVAADVDTTPDTPAEDEEESVIERLKGDVGEFDPAALAKAVTTFYAEDLAPTLQKMGMGARDIGALAIKGLYPRIAESNPVGRILGVAAPTDAVDALMRLKGEQARSMAEFDLVMRQAEKFFSRLPEQQQVNFIDRIQTGQRQPTGELQDLADSFKEIMDAQREQETAAFNLERKGQQIDLSKKQNYFPNRWKKKPGTNEEETEEERIGRIAVPRRPLEGSKGYNKQQTYTLKGGIEKGGEPYTTNPVRVLRNRLEDGMKLVAARRAWKALRDLDLRVFVRKGARPPAGFDKIDDRIAKVYMPVEITYPGAEEAKESHIQSGEWYVEANTARLLNNMLSRDLIRGTAAGRGLMWLKNASTALELGVSPFHAVFETIEAMSSQMATGMLRTYNLGVLKGNPAQIAQGLKDILASPVAPVTMAREGSALPAYIEARSRLAKIGITQFGHTITGNQPHGAKEAFDQWREMRKEKAVQRLFKQYPDLDQLIDDMFAGGMVIGQHRDYQVKINGQTAGEAWSSGNPLGAFVRSVPTVLQGAMNPLFNWYIPSLKYSLFFRLMSEQAAEHAAELDAGSMTREELARKVVDSVENRFGELNFDNLFWNRTVKSTLQFIFRSATWKLGNIREFSGAAGGQVKEISEWAQDAYHRMGGEEGKQGPLPRLDMHASWVASLVFLTVAMGTIATKILSHKWPWEWTEEEAKEKSLNEWQKLRQMFLETMHPRTGETDSRNKPVRISLPTYAKDIEHAISSPAQYVMSSFSSILSRGMDIAENRDYFGNFVYNPNASLGTKLKQVGRYAFPTPFTISNYERGKQVGEGKTALLSAFGFPRAPSDLDFTPAEKKLQAFLKTSRAPATPEQLQEWRERREKFLKGEMSSTDARRYVKNQRLTWLQREFKSPDLKYPQAVQVYNVANEDEQRELRGEMRTKRENFLKRYGRGAEQQAESTP